MAPWAGIAFRQIVASATATELGSISAAARALDLAQSSVSRELRALEEALGVPLHQRAGNATRATEAGRLLAPRFAYMSAHLRGAAAQLARHVGRPETESAALRFLVDLRVHRAGQLLTLQESRSIRAAAALLGISADAVRKILRETRQRLAFALFERREGGRLQPTVEGEILLARIRVLCREVAHAAADLAAMTGRRGGLLAIGCLPSGASLIPPAVCRTLELHPHIQARLVEGTYDDLIHKLQSGHLDVVVGGLPPAARFADLHLESLFEDRLGVFARAGHPLATHRRLRSADFARYRWIMPERGAVAEPVLEVLLERAGIHPHLPRLEYSSIVALHGLLQSGDMLALGSRSQLQGELRAGQVIELACPLPASSWPCGVISRAAAPPSVAMNAFIESLRSMIRDHTPPSG